MTALPTDLPADQSCRDTHSASVGRDSSPPIDHCAHDAQRTSVDGRTPLPADQQSDESHTILVGRDSSPPIDHPNRDTHTRPVDGRTLSSSADQPDLDTHSGSVGRGGLSRRHADDLLLIHAETVDGLERLRQDTSGRLRALVAEPMEGDKGGRFGKGFPVNAPEVVRLSAMVDSIAALEHQAVLDLQRAMRKHPLGPWVKRTVGVGDKQAARLLAAIGDPYWHDVHGRPRTVSELWAYCGYHVVLPTGHSTTETRRRCAGGQPLPVDHAGSDTHTGRVDGDVLPTSLRNADTQRDIAGGQPLPADQPSNDHHRILVGGDPSSGTGQVAHETHVAVAGVAPKRRRGAQANWNTSARSRAYLIATSCMKQRHSPYRAIYEDGRAKYAGAIVNGKPITDGHAHNRALRLVAKALLRDLWLESKRLHE